MAPNRSSRSASLLALASILFSSSLFLAAAQEAGLPGTDAAAAGAQTTTSSPALSIASQACKDRLQQLGFSSNLPVVLIQLTNTSQVAKATAVQLQLLAKGPHLPGVMTTCGGPDDNDVLDQPIRMRVRGSSSAVEYAKKSFSLDPVDQVADFASAKTAGLKLLGFPKSNDWVLHGPENDRTTGMRNWLGYNMARWMGRYASRTKYFELFLNPDPTTPLSMQHYRGIYMLQEKVSRDKSRVNVTKFDASADLSGGYLLAYENDNTDEKSIMLTTRLSKLTFLLEYPNDRSDAIIMWLQKWLNDFESKLLSLPVANMTEWLDVNAAIDYFIITEITKNPDGYRGSIKTHKDRNGPLVLGPIWDLNEAFGLCCGYPIEGYKRGGASNGTSGGSAISAAGWRFNICQDPGRCKVEPADGISQWYRKMWQEPAFRTAAAARWAQLRALPDGVLRDQVVINEIVSLKRLLGSGPGTAGARNFDKWKAALNVPGFGVSFADWPTMFETETKLLTDWVLARLKWLDAAFAAVALPAAAPDAYLTMGHVVAEPPVAGPAAEGANGQNVGPAVAGK